MLELIKEEYLAVFEVLSWPRLGEDNGGECQTGGLDLPQLRAAQRALRWWMVRTSIQKTTEWHHQAQSAMTRMVQRKPPWRGADSYHQQRAAQKRSFVPLIWKVWLHFADGYLTLCLLNRPSRRPYMTAAARKRGSWKVRKRSARL